jgi:hypothetical protein
MRSTCVTQVLYNRAIQELKKIARNAGVPPAFFNTSTIMQIKSLTSRLIQGLDSSAISRWISVAGAVLIAVLYFKVYFANPALPTTTIDGWWTWWDHRIT